MSLSFYDNHAMMILVKTLQDNVSLDVRNLVSDDTLHLTLFIGLIVLFKTLKIH